MSRRTIVVVGGGIAGISCLEAIINQHNTDDTLVLITNSRIIKRVKNYDLNAPIDSCDIEEQDIQTLLDSRSQALHLKLIVGSVTSLNISEKKIYYQQCDVESDRRQESELTYDILCLCHGSKPTRLTYANSGNNPMVDERVIVIKDTDTVDELRKKLTNCRRLVVVGNGGISLELVHKISNCEIVWIVRDESIGCTFFDSGAAKFLLDTLSNYDKTRSAKTSVSYSASLSEETSNRNHYGPALGPNWSQNIKLSGNGILSHNLNIIYQDEVDDIVYEADGDYPISVLTRNNEKVCCDLVVTAVGVEANRILSIEGEIETSPSDGGVVIDEQMRTSVKGIYAAGDVASCEKWTNNELWLQMRLWTQARQMGHYAGMCIINHIRNQDPSIYFQFDCFTHSTSFFGYKLVLLGRYNGQACDSSDNLDVIVRVDPGNEYVKVLTKDDKVYGAVLVGETGKEDMLENMIRSGLLIDDKFKDGLLDDTIEIEDYYD